MDKYLTLGAVLLTALFVLLLNGAGAAPGALGDRAYLPVLQNGYEEFPLPPSVAWKATQLAGPPGYAQSLAATPKGDVLALSLTDSGIQLYRSQDEGGNWSLVDDPVLGHEIMAYRLYSSPAGSQEGTVYAIGFSGLARSSDGGSSWQRTGGNLPVQQIVALAFSPAYENHGTVYALSAIAGETGPYICVSQDQGESWQVLADVAEDRNSGLIPNDLAAFGPGGLAIATSSGILRSEDSGGTWQQVTDPFAESGTTPGIRALAKLSSGELLAASSGQRIPYKSSDGGLTWRWTGTGMDASGQYQGGLGIASAQGRIFLAAAGIEGNTPGLFYSPDGSRWRLIPLGLPAGAGISALGALSADTLFVSTGDQGLWKAEALS